MWVRPTPTWRLWLLLMMRAPTATDNDDHTVGADDVAPAVSIVKDGEATINEGGDTATYSIEITNNSVSTDPLTVTSLVDDQFGDLLPEAEAAYGGGTDRSC